MDSSNSLTLADLCNELGLPDQFVLDLANSAEDDKRYNSYSRPKKSGGRRYINASIGSLKRLQRAIYDHVLAKYEMPPYLHGGIKGKSIVTNATAHVGKKIVVNMDLSDFFGSIKKNAVKQIYLEKFFFDEQAATVLTQLSTFRGTLPTGAPTSSALANLAALPLDDLIIATLNTQFARSEFGYSRYVDDITISGDENILIEQLPNIFDAINSCGFTCNDKKTRILRRTTRQWVTGVVVNQKLNPPRKIIRKVRQAIYYLKKWGLEEHCETHGVNPYRFMRQLSGYIAYIRLTQPDVADDFLYELKPFTAKFNAVEEHVPSVLSILKSMIDNEVVAHFIYQDSILCSVAPESIDVDDYGSITMRGFELAPAQRWNIYELDQITEISSDPLPPYILERIKKPPSS